MSLVRFLQGNQHLWVHTGIVVAGETTPVGVMKSHQTIMTVRRLDSACAGDTGGLLNGGSKLLGERLIEHG